MGKADDVRKAKPEMMEAQQLWDHSMALSIAESLRASAGTQGSDVLVLHVCGAFHCTHGLGIPEVLPLYAQDLLDEGVSAPATTTVTGQVSPEAWLPMDDALSK